MAPKKLSRKFDNQDREQVISEVEKHFDVKLHPIGTRKKYLKDENGKRYWVFGGYDYWHGIPSEMMDAEIQESEKASFIVAVRKKTRIDIYDGSIEPLVVGRNRLKRNKKRDYQFTVEERLGQLDVKEIKGLKLRRIAVREYSINQKDSDRDSFLKGERIKNFVSKLSDEDKADFLSQFKVDPKK